MNLALSIPEPFLSQLKFIEARIASAGHECFLVGGSVRDLYMGKIPAEYDLTTSARPELIKSLFKSVIETGIKHGTVTILHEKCPYEITTYRIDKDYTDGRHPDQVEFGSSLLEDLRRRDFTMNALALNLITGEIIDHHNGKTDIDNRIIRTIGNPIHRFSEDGLRPIRAMRFASVLNFEIEKDTRLAIRESKKITAKISVERLQDEILKSLKGNSPSTMLKLFIEEDILSLFVNDFQMETRGALEESNLSVLDKIPKTNPGYQIGVWAFSLGPLVSSTKWESWLQKLKFSNAIVKDAVFVLTLIHLSKAQSSPVDDYEIRKNFLVPIKKHLEQRRLVVFPVWSVLEVFSWNWLERGIILWEENPPLLLSDLAINGKDIEQLFPTLPKPRYGELLHFLLDQVWRMPENNQKPYLRKQCDYFLSNM